MYAGDEYYGDEITSPIERPQAAPVRHIVSFLNRRGDYEADVNLTTRGYVVRIIDIDSGEVLPQFTIFQTEDAARAYALKCVTADDDEELPL